MKIYPTILIFLINSTLSAVSFYIDINGIEKELKYLDGTVVSTSEDWVAGASIRDSSYQSVNLEYANLQSVNFTGTDLSFSNFFGADLSSADLAGANLSYADLRYSDLDDFYPRGDAPRSGIVWLGAKMYQAVLPVGYSQEWFEERGADFSAVPEPSTYALILGALVLGFVAYRRK